MAKNQAENFVSSILEVEGKITAAAVRTTAANDVGIVQVFADGSVLCRYADADYIEEYASEKEFEEENESTLGERSSSEPVNQAERHAPDSAARTSAIGRRAER